jgi:hypothetical protein
MHFPAPVVLMKESRMPSAKRSFAVAAALAAVVGAASPAAAASPGPNRAFIGFIAPVAGQAVQLGVKGGFFYCFRWPGGVNTGQPADVDTGIEGWNAYNGRWTREAGTSFSEAIRTDELTAQLFDSASNEIGSGFACQGKPISEVKRLPIRSSGDTYYVDFR